MLPVRQFIPVSRNPSTTSRRSTPDTTNPDIILSFIIKSPITRNPNYIVTIRLVIRRNFIHDFRRGLFYNHPRLRIVIYLRCKCLMHRPSCQCFNVFVIAITTRCSRWSILSLDSPQNKPKHE
jgi:hypothetical protein